LGIKNSPTQLLIIDGHALVFRAYFAFQTTNMKNSKTGEPSGAVFGFFRMFFKLLHDYPSSHIAFTFDPGTPLKRSKLFSEYKATRKPMPEELKPQIREVMDIVRELGYPLLVEDGEEADDIIGSLCKKFGDKNEIVICSGDKDLYQLLLRNNIKMLRGKKGTSDFIIINSEWVVNELGVKPEQITDYMGIVGDTSDNIPGVKGIGDKGASTLIKEYQSLDSIYANIDSVKNTKWVKLV
jgi:DNA polymerase-1